MKSAIIALQIVRKTLKVLTFQRQKPQCSIQNGRNNRISGITTENVNKGKINDKKSVIFKVTILMRQMNKGTNKKVIKSRLK